MNSSDWIDQAAVSDAVPVPDWIAALGSPGEFSDASPFARLQRAAQKAPQAEEQAGPALETAPQQSDWDRGYAAGEAAGRASADAGLAAVNDQKLALRTAFRTLDQAAMDALADELSDTVMALCENLLAAHAVDPAALLERAQEAAKRLGTAASSCQLHLNPDDIALLEESALAHWEVVPDDTLERGSIALTGPEGGVRDGPAEWRRAIAAAMRG